MRGFFVLLLLTNVGFLTWQYVHRGTKPGEDDIYHGITMVNDGLTMLGELPSNERPALREPGSEGVDSNTTAIQQSQKLTSPNDSGLPERTSEAVDSTKDDNPTVRPEVCLHIDDIDGRSSLDQLLILLKSNGAAAIEQGEKQVKKTNYWVMLPPYPTRAKADEAAAILNAKQVKDFFIVRSGEFENAVSLGVFSSRDRAKRRYEQILGLKGRLRSPKIEAIELPAKRYFVNYKLTNVASRMKLEQQMRDKNYQSSEEISCK